MFTKRINGAKCNFAVSAEQQRESNFVELLLITGNKTKLSIPFGFETGTSRRVEGSRFSN
jgi:hypothetical protein